MNLEGFFMVLQPELMATFAVLIALLFVYLIVRALIAKTATIETAPGGQVHESFSVAQRWAWRGFLILVTIVLLGFFLL